MLKLNKKFVRKIDGKSISWNMRLWDNINSVSTKKGAFK